MVPPTVKSDGNEGPRAPSAGAPSPDDPTRTAASLGAPTSQPSVPPALFHAPERYQILGEHGRGGLGRVSRAHDRELGRDVAIKELISRGSVSEVRFLREAMITARLEHPGIVPVHEAGRWPDGTPYYAMKLVAGRPLRELIAERTTVDQRIGLLHHVIAVADAIAYAHGRNIIHRDLKPANVIVGDFGETIVIDWGLAKDLSTTEESTVGGGPFRAPHNNDLTAAGAVLGTPSYMAPEQERGEQVDQRADVFAIGAMLWEICSLQKIPPANLGFRHRLLRRARIDQDLTVIIDKALDPDPSRRYPNAGALAADLKAFKSGARISARVYSPTGMFVHWTRRHRALAGSGIGALIFLLAGSALYLRSVTAERNRADEANRATSLKNAELLLASDPSAAWDILATYNGADTAQVRLLRAKAIGLGIASKRTSVHRDSIARLQPLSDGMLLSLSVDGSIATTTADGRSRLVASNAIGRNVSAWSPTRELLAYPCHPDGTCFFAVNSSLIPPHLPDRRTPSYIDFSRNGRRLAVRYEADVVVWDLGDKDARQLSRATIPDAKRLFYASDALIVATARQIGVIDPASATFEPLIDFPASVAASDEDDIIFGNPSGDLLLLPSSDFQHKSLISEVCDSAVNAVAIDHVSGFIAYGCQDGDVGVRSVSEPTKLIARFHHGTAVLSVVLAKDYQHLIFGDQHGAMLIYDFPAHRTTIYHGQATRLLRASAPTRSFPYFASGDDDGSIRLWNLPSNVPRTIINSRFPLFDTALLEDGTVIGVGRDPLLHWWRNGTSGTLPGHEAGALALRRSPDLAHFVTFGPSGDMILWGTEPLAAIRRMNSGTITNAIFTNDGQSVVSSGQDGRLLLWLAGREEPQLLAKFGEPLSSVEVLRSKEALVVADRKGSLWLLDVQSSSNAPRVPVQLRVGQGKSISHLVVSDDDQWICIGTTEGEVLLYSATTYEPTLLMKAQGAIHVIVFSADRSLIAVVSEDGHVYLIDSPAASLPTHPHWRKLRLAARNARFSPDGNLLAITTNSDGVYFYSLSQQDWQYFSFQMSMFFAVASREMGEGLPLWMEAAILPSSIQTLSHQTKEPIKP
jgi:WD40 repeat protein